MFWYRIAAVVIGIVILYVLYDRYQKEKLRRQFRGDYFNWDKGYYDFESLSMIRRFWDEKNRMEAPQYKIDDTTWNDLDMDRLFFKMNACQSSTGEEYLYARLRSVGFDEEELVNFGNTVDCMQEIGETRVEALCALHTLGKDLYNHVYAYIYRLDEQPIKNVKKFYLLMILPLVCIASCFFTPFGFAFTIVALLVNILVYYKYKSLLEMNLNSIGYISKMTYCAYELSKLDFGKLSYQRDIASALKPLRGISALGNSLTRKAGTDLEMLLQYIKIILMWDFINYDRMIRILLKHRAEFQRIYELIGQLDCAIAVGAYRNTLDYYTTPRFYNMTRVVCEELYHPLLKQPVPNSVEWKRNAIITGSNASGKSTFVKALALTMICAQNLHLCFARQYTGQMSFVVTSMAVKDMVYGGESYFIAEVKSIKRILDAINNRRRVVCFIDEILRGTNTIERIASSASILQWLTGKNCLAMIASHDRELTEILGSACDSYHFREQVKDDGIIFDYTLYPGAANTRNAIKLLQFMGFDNEIIASANRMASRFEENSVWDAML